MRTIPQIRERLHELAAIHGIQELADLADETRRRSPVRRARRKLPKLTPELKAEIVAAAEQFPDASYQEIAEFVNTNIGRVSEALVGKREDA